MIADDHRIVREGLTYLLNAEPDLVVIGVASDGLEIIELVRKCHPDIVLMDLQMPNLDGLEAIRQLKREDEGVKIIILTIYDTNVHIVEGLRAGAQGYFLKDVPREELYQAIRLVHLGQPLLYPPISAWLPKAMVKEATEPHLTTRELEV